MYNHLPREDDTENKFKDTKYFYKPHQAICCSRLAMLIMEHSMESLFDVRET